MPILDRTALGSTGASRLDPRVEPGRARGDKKSNRWVKAPWFWYKVATWRERPRGLGPTGHALTH
jgi:hypothetical protein